MTPPFEIRESLAKPRRLQVSIRLSAEEDQLIGRLADRLGIQRCDLFRRAVNEFLEREGRPIRESAHATGCLSLTSSSG